MRLRGLRVVEPAHVLTICGAPGGKVGSCRCGRWSVVSGPSSDDVTMAFLDHVVAVGAVTASACDVCQTGIAVIRHGAVELCSRCALAERRAEIVGAGMSGWSDGHPSRREDPDQSDALVAAQ